MYSFFLSFGSLQRAMAAVDDVATGVNTFYLLFAGALVYFMQPGFAMYVEI
jgi:hypothetical protein